MTVLARFINVLQTRTMFGHFKQFGEVQSPFEFAIKDDFIDGHVTLAASGNAELFDGSETDPFATAQVIWIASDRDLIVQLTFDTAGVNGKEVMTLTVKGSGEAKKLGHPFVLAKAQAYSNYTEDFAAGTLVYCDRVTVLNTDSSNSAYVQYFIGEQA